MNLNETGLFLKNERTKENISQEELSFLTGISHGQLSRIESGNLNFTMLSFIKICSALNINEFNLKNDDFESLHPFVKWAGGKTQILDKISIFFPKNFNRYFE